jgi:hypothetical protein
MQHRNIWFVLSLVATFGGGFGTSWVVFRSPLTEEAVQVTAVPCLPTAEPSGKLGDRVFHDAEIKHSKSKGY